MKTIIKKLLDSGLAFTSGLNLYVRDWRRGKNPDIENTRHNLSPIFVIGVNRCGTSIISYILSQHPELEGLFSGNLGPGYNESGHSYGYCESMHIWRHLMPTLEKGYLPLWGLPMQLGKTYRDRVKNNGERRRLALDVQLNRKTDKSPLLKNNLNTLRIGLINDVYPHARFVLVCRSVDEFISSSIHKWKTDGSGTFLKLPLASYHWHIVNLIARYELAIYAPSRHSIIWLDKLNKNQQGAKEVFGKLCADLSLQSHEFDFAAVKKFWDKKNLSGSMEMPDDSGITSIIDKERRIIKENK